MSYIRYYAQTHGSGTAVAALAYLRSIIRIADVRLVTMSGVLEGAWDAMSNLLVTPLEAPLVANVVCTEPEAWAHRLSIPMPATEHSPAGKAEKVIELYTAGVRNILIATSIPRSKAHCDAAAKYEAVIVPTAELGHKLAGAIGREPIVIPVPVTNHAAVRAAIIT